MSNLEIYSIELWVGILSIVSIVNLWLVLELKKQVTYSIQRLEIQQRTTQKILNDIYASLNKSNEYLYKIASLNEPLRQQHDIQHSKII